MGHVHNFKEEVERWTVGNTTWVRLRCSCGIDTVEATDAQ